MITNDTAQAGVLKNNEPSSTGRPTVKKVDQCSQTLGCSWSTCSIEGGLS